MGTGVGRKCGGSVAAWRKISREKVLKFRLKTITKLVSWEPERVGTGVGRKCGGSVADWRKISREKVLKFRLKTITKLVSYLARR